MDDLQYKKVAGYMDAFGCVLNLVINGWPSIHLRRKSLKKNQI